jgi:hypothetical protein
MAVGALAHQKVRRICFQRGTYCAPRRAKLFIYTACCRAFLGVYRGEAWINLFQDKCRSAVRLAGLTELLGLHRFFIHTQAAAPLAVRLLFSGKPITYRIKGNVITYEAVGRTTHSMM